MLTPGSIFALRWEVDRARAKFPKNDLLFTALVEEVGELAQAYLQRKPIDEIRKEALQIACVAMRIFEEGDPTYNNVTDEQAQK